MGVSEIMRPSLFFALLISFCPTWTTQQGVRVLVGRPSEAPRQGSVEPEPPPASLLQGTVSAGGELVEGAKVRCFTPHVSSTEYVAGIRSIPASEETALTDAAGRFELEARCTDSSFLQVELPRRGAVLVDCPPVEPGQRSSLILVDAGEPASLEARVLLAPDHEDDLVELIGSAGGRVLADPDEEGRLSLEGLVPGAWRVAASPRIDDCFAARMREITGTDHDCDRYCFGLLRNQAPFYVAPLELPAGSETRAELDLTGQGARVLKGGLRLIQAGGGDDSQIVRCRSLFSWPPSVWLTEPGNSGQRVALARSYEGFRLRVRAAGVYDLTISQSSALEITDRVEIDESREEWHCEIQLVRVEIRARRHDGELPELEFVWEGPGARRARGGFVRFEYPGERGARLVGNVPAGKFVLYRLDDPHPRTPVAVGWAKAGKTLKLRLP